MLRLSDEQLLTVERMAAPLQSQLRGAFLQRVAELLSFEREIGDGNVSLACRVAQRELMHAAAPALGEEKRRPMPAKWSRANRRRPAAEVG